MLQGFLQRAHFDVEIARDGAEALDLIDVSPPDLVVTDLQMPRMNGLELIEAVQRDHRSVPVILLTQFGSEELAIEALERGAAGYVPKKLLNRELLRVVDDVLSASTLLHRQKALSDSVVATSSSFELRNDDDLISPLTERLEHDLDEMQFLDRLAVIRVAVALREALLNAIHHGNLEVDSNLRLESDAPYNRLLQQRRREPAYRERRVHVEARHTRSEAVYTVRDEGKGFDPSHLPDPREPGNLDKPSGRGLLLIHAFMDEVRFNSQGNEIVMIKRSALQTAA
jgi:DNA-binding response OmpR family regulator